MGISNASPIYSTSVSVVCLLFLLSISCTSTSLGSSPEATAFFIFGDSLVDAGNNNYIETIPAFKANYRPYGQNGFFDEPTGRALQGWPSDAKYGKLPMIPPFLRPSANFVHGANFASGGAGVLPETNAGLEKFVDSGMAKRKTRRLSGGGSSRCLITTDARLVDTSRLSKTATLGKEGGWRQINHPTGSKANTNDNVDDRIESNTIVS